MVSPRTTARSHYGNPLITSFHSRDPSSPSSVTKGAMSKPCLEQEQQQHRVCEQRTGNSTNIHQPSFTNCQLPTFIGARPQPLVTPNPSFGDRDQSQQKQEDVMDVTSGWSLPGYVPPGLPSEPSTRSPRGRKRQSSVGLPSQYPSHGRNNSLIESLVEELQDFDELFGSSSTSVPRRFDDTSMDLLVFPAEGGRNETSSSITSASSSSSSCCTERTQFFADSTMEMQAPPAVRCHRRSRNQAMGISDFYNKVLKDL